KTKKVSKWYSDAGVACVVPSKPKQAFAIMVGLRHPDVGDLSRPRNIRQHASFARLKDPEVGVTPGSIPG
ncbi:MAG TPA: hypothetical protein VGJ84_07925, partial [Polyangiaceae bacterium]